MNLVSVILTVYNCEQYIQKCVDSLLCQTYSNLEILVCDDCSTDNTWNVLKSYQDVRIRLYRNEVNKGVVYTRNFLLEKASGDFFLIQDGDDWSDIDRVKILLNAFERDEELGACGTASYRVNNKGVLSKNQLDQKSFVLNINDCLSLPFMPATLMLKRNVYDELGGYNEYFSGLFAEDLYWVLRITEQYKVLYVNQSLYYYRFNADSITNTVGRREKLVVMDLMYELIHQRKRSGLDWIEENDKVSIDRFISEKFDDKKWLSERYRIVAAVQRDGGKRWIALKIIFKSILCNPFSIKNYITLKYIIFF